MNLDSLLRERTDLWRGGDPNRPTGGELLPSGQAELDRVLGGGWPRGALSEILGPAQGLAVLGLLLPALARRGYRVGSVPVSTIYGDETSSINPLVDAGRFVRLVTILLRSRRDEGRA